LSRGLADLSKPEHLEQVKKKHPPPKQPVQTSLNDFGEAGTRKIEVSSLFEKLRSLPIHAGIGPDGMHNGHLRDLAAMGSAASAEAIRRIDRCQDMCLSAALPDWWCKLCSAKSLVGLFKEDPVTGVVTPIRPIGVGNVLGRARLFFAVPSTLLQCLTRRVLVLQAG